MMQLEYLIVLYENGVGYKTTKLIFSSDGSINVVVPYHNANQGLLFKGIVDYKKRQQIINFEDATQYSIKNKAKLSIHKTGFVQFSGNNILSGIDQESGEPKGLGIFSQPLFNPIQSGPTFSLLLWGIEDYVNFKQKKKNEVVIKFNESDYYYRYCNTNNWKGYLIEGFIMKRKTWISHMHIKEKKSFLRLISNNYELPGTAFDYRIIPFFDQDYIVTILVSRTTLEFDAPSGFSLASSSQLIENGGKGVMLFAMYPSPASPDSPFICGNLDYPK